MANPAEAVIAVVSTPVTWAKAKPFVFSGFLLLTIILAIKFAPQILALFGRAPVVGGRVVAFAQPRP